MNITERINRILFIMSYVSQHQGVPLEELAKAVGMRPRQLEKELDFMLLIGKPPFRPDDYVDIYVDEDDQRVYIDFDQMLNRPLRFTRPEAMAMLLSLELLDPQVDPEAVQSLKDKIQQVIGSSVDPTARLQDQIVMESPAVSEHFEQLRQATEQSRKIEIDYYALIRDQTSRRVVRPYLMTKHLGYWYLTGYCETRQDVRTFKFERILDVRMRDETFRPPPDLAPFKDAFLDFGPRRFEIYFDQAWANWILEEWGDLVRYEGDGVVLTLTSETPEFPTRLALSYAPHARPVSPKELVEAVHKEAQRIMDLYQDEDGLCS